MKIRDLLMLPAIDTAGLTWASSRVEILSEMEFPQWCIIRIQS